MNWHDGEIEEREGAPMFKGLVKLTNDKNEVLGSVLWFYDEGPFYAHAMDANDTNITRRIGPCMTLVGAQQAVYDAIEGRENISDRAGYPRSREP